jgi:hypothetical protein
MTHHTYTLYFPVYRTVVTNCKHNTFNMVVMLVCGSSDEKLHISNKPIIPAIFRTPYWTIPVLPHNQSLELRSNCNHLLSSFGPIPSHWIHCILTLRNQYWTFQFSWSIMCVCVKNWFTWLQKLEKLDVITLYEYLAFKKRVHIHVFLKNILECHENTHVTNIYSQTGLISSLKFSYTFWGTFAKLRKATISLVIPSVCPSAWNNSPPTRWISMKICIRVFFENLSGKNNFY